jgi:phosphoglycerate kinase
MTALPRTLDQIELDGRKVLCRVDFNVPMKGTEITDDTRIVSALPTIRYLQERAEKVILCSHLGRPKGKRVEELSLLPAAARLAELLDVDVVFSHDTVGEEVSRIIDDQPPHSIIVLENLRFDPGETANDEAFGKALSDLAEVYVDDAFGAMHREHASIVAPPKHLAHYGVGRLVEAEVRALGGLLTQPKRPFAAVLGGAKVSDKIEMIDRLASKVDHMFIGGAMAYTFLAAQGVAVGSSRVEADSLEVARKLLAEATARGCRFHLPTDHVVATSFAAEAEHKVVQQIEDGWMGLDIGPATAEAWARLLSGCKTLFWNGPLGVFEWEAFSNGTRTIANAFAAADGYTVLGGGDSAAAAAAFGVSARIDHISTGGGASLELLRDGDLVGLQALRKRR